MKIDVQEIGKTGISQLGVHYISREFEYKLLSGNYDVIFRIDSKKLRNLSTKQELLLYILLRILKQTDETGFLNVVFSDYNEYLIKKSFFNQPRYFYLQQLNEKQFNYEIDSELWNTKSRRHFYRVVNQKTKDGKDSIDLLKEILLSCQFHLISKTRPKRTQRHKGYRDHGSLGSEFSRSQRQQIQSEEWRKICEREEKRKQDFLEFLRGLAE